jgi:hypothetical protein
LREELEELNFPIAKIESKAQEACPVFFFLMKEGNRMGLNKLRADRNCLQQYANRCLVDVKGALRRVTKF